jgi:excinuclease UvrABC nuclease subunit
LDRWLDEMPFINRTPYVYKPASVQIHAPSSSGVYGISNAREWIYIGETDNIKARLLEHLQNNDTVLLEKNPTGFTFELCQSFNRLDRQNRLITELHPACISLK